MKTGIISFALLLSLCVIACAQTSSEQCDLTLGGMSMSKLQGLIFNQDSTDFFYTNELRAGMDAGKILDDYFDFLADAGVTVLMINTNARKTNYKSDAWESYFEGYDPDAPDDQPYFSQVPAGEIPGYRKMIHSMMELDRQGIDYPARVIERCRLRGMSPWISLRMNDAHFNDNLGHPFHGEMWRKPELFRGGSGYYARNLDYAHPEVRDYYRILVEETLNRYDIDGLELDFMREVYLFENGAEQAGAKILTAWLDEIRQLVDEASARRGHPILMGVRIPSHLEVTQSWGLDVVTWAKKKLVDLVVATPRWATLEYDMPLEDYKNALAGTGVTLAGGLEILHRPLPAGYAAPVSKEQAAGAAAAVLANGADVVYLFNYFNTIADAPNWTHEGYRQTFHAMHSLDTLAALPRRHAITWRDIAGCNEQYTPPLPAEGKTLTFSLSTGPKPPVNAEVTLELRLVQAIDAPAPVVKVNQTACTMQSVRPDGDGVVMMTFSIPWNALSGDQRNVFQITTTTDKLVTVSGLEVSIVP